MPDRRRFNGLLGWRPYFLSSLIRVNAFSASSRASSRIRGSFECGYHIRIIFSRDSFEYVIFSPLLVTNYPPLFVAKLLFKRSQNKSVNDFPDVGNKPDWLKDASLVIVAEVIGADLIVEEKDALGEQVFPEPFGVRRKSSLVDPEDNEANVAEDEFLGLSVSTTFGCSDEPPFLLERNPGIFTNNVAVRFPHTGIFLDRVARKATANVAFQ
ncbi:MAG: hypothetical protein WC530_02020 [Candidatus Omnitrophota bacterium]|jgi:hypothetical protein